MHAIEDSNVCECVRACLCAWCVLCVFCGVCVPYLEFGGLLLVLLELSDPHQHPQGLHKLHVVLTLLVPTTHTHRHTQSQLENNTLLDFVP
jgi:hypothetical protein